MFNKDRHKDKILSENISPKQTNSNNLNSTKTTINNH